MSASSFYRLLIVFTSLTFMMASESQQEPLLFIDDPKDVKRVRLLWNPAYDVDKVLELSQQVIKYVKVNGSDQLAPTTNGWQTLVTPDLNHTGRNRYVFVKDSLCHEMQFRTSWRNSNGKEFHGRIQKVPPMTIRKNFGAKVALANIQGQGQSGSATATILWHFPLDEWPSLDLSDIKLHISLLQCRTMFNREVRIPTISANNSVSFEKEFIDHGCRFEISLRFPYFDEETACYLVFETAPDESLTIELDCEQLNLPCLAPPEVPCEMFCNPPILNGSAEFLTVENRTVITIQFDWEFKRPAARYLIRYQPIWVLYENRPLDVGNFSVEFLQNGESHLALEPFSKVPEAAYGLQICAVYDANCRLQRLNWASIPTFGERFYSLLDARPAARLPIHSISRPTIPPPTAEFAKTTPVRKQQHTDNQSPQPALLRNSAIKTFIKFEMIFIGVIWYYLMPALV